MLWEICNNLKRLKNNEKYVFHYIKLKNQLELKVMSQKLDQDTRGITQHKDNRLQSPEQL